MIPDVNVFGSFFCDRVQGNEDGALIISANGDRTKVETKLPQKGMNPDNLSAAIRESHVFGFCR